MIAHGYYYYKIMPYKFEKGYKKIDGWIYKLYEHPTDKYEIVEADEWYNTEQEAIDAAKEFITAKLENGERV